MRRIRATAAIAVCAFAIHAAPQGAVAGPTQNAQPPAQWAAYIEAARKADGIADNEARCRAYPDLPGNHWLPGAAQARCSLLRKPAVSLDEMDRLLSTPDGPAELERRFAALLKAHYEDQSQREQIFVSLFVFDDSDRSRQISQRWLELSPESAFAHAAVARHHDSSGWKARGAKFIRDTPEASVQSMTHEFALAVPLYAKAMEIEPRLSFACVRMAAIGRQSSDALQRYAMDRCTKVDPDSYYLALERETGSQPRWGGSDEELRMAIAYAAARVGRNPILGALLGEHAGYGPSAAKNLGEVARELEAAALMAPSGRLSADTGRGYRVKGDPWAAVGYLSQATRFWPDDAEYRNERGGVLYDRLDDAAWALRDMLKSVELAPEDSKYAYRTGQVTRAVSGEVAARPFFKRAMEDPKRRGAAMEMYCQTYVLAEATTSDAQQCTLDLVTEYPESAEGWRQRGWVLYLIGSPDAVAAIDRYVQLADRNDPFHQRGVEIALAQKAELESWMGKSGKPAGAGPQAH